ncbi:hypothetical protein [Acinetobacter sp. ASP199]|uniref:hypothetical protein n=1 Tax=unclassified Acinetobacter TaxID=196816 RepID=UPI001F615074|nr:hypothetical protein [Acinetobacter sp. ASP199]UNT58878.1 hypothetical protein IHE35_12425 [Acinetobacter sp. ASP199]
MKNTIKTIALSVTFLSGAGMAYAQDTNVEVDTGLQASLDAISQQVENGSALNLAVNSADINASVNTEAYADLGTDTQEVVNTVENTIETTAIGAANTGSIEIAQGSLSRVTSDTLNETLDSEYTELNTLDDSFSDDVSTSDLAQSADISDTLSTTMDSSFSEEINETLSNYSVANIAYNAGAIDASVSAIATGVDNSVTNSITTTAIGAVNTGSITVTVGE